MARQIVLEVLLILGITVVLAWLALGAFALADSADPMGTLVDQTPRVLFGLLGVALGLWALLVIIGAIVQRRRRVGWRIATHLVSLVAALIINIGLLTVISVASGGPGHRSRGCLRQFSGSSACRGPARHARVARGAGVWQTLLVPHAVLLRGSLPGSA